MPDLINISCYFKFDNFGELNYNDDASKINFLKNLIKHNM